MKRDFKYLIFRCGTGLMQGTSLMNNFILQLKFTHLHSQSAFFSQRSHGDLEGSHGYLQHSAHRYCLNLTWDKRWIKNNLNVGWKNLSTTVFFFKTTTCALKGLYLDQFLEVNITPDISIIILWRIRSFQTWLWTYSEISWSTCSP